eukprot:2091150-Prymnesium_polylepis.1
MACERECLPQVVLKPIADNHFHLPARDGAATLAAATACPSVLGGSPTRCRLPSSEIGGTIASTSGEEGSLRGGGGSLGPTSPLTLLLPPRTIRGESVVELLTSLLIRLFPGPEPHGATSERVNFCSSSEDSSCTRRISSVSKSIPSSSSFTMEHERINNRRTVRTSLRPSGECGSIAHSLDVTLTTTACSWLTALPPRSHLPKAWVMRKEKRMPLSSAKEVRSG